MPADYKNRANGRGKKSKPGFMWFLAGLALGLFATLIVYLSKLPDKHVSFASAVQHDINKMRSDANKTTNKKPAQKNPEDKKTKKPKFNFYTILPELEVMIPDSETKMPNKNQDKSGTSNKASTSKRYILQVGSVRNQSDAEKFKARLALLGFEANIQKVSVNGENWYRVRIGPFNSTSEMYHDIDELHRHNIDAMAMELK